MHEHDAHRATLLADLYNPAIPCEECGVDLAAPGAPDDVHITDSEGDHFYCEECWDKLEALDAAGAAELAA